MANKSKFKPTETWKNVCMFPWVKDRTRRPKALKVGKQKLVADRFGIKLSPATPYVIVALDAAEFELVPTAARAVALEILRLCNEIEK